MGELREAFPDLAAGVWNCRKISGTSIWSQHAWGNALDLYHRDFGYSTKVEHQVYLDGVWQFIETYTDELSIRIKIWRKRDHFNHIHLDFWPKGYGTPPCDKETNASLRMQYNSGNVVNGDPGPANGYHELPDKELVTVSEAQVLKRGSEGISVARLQRDLISLGYDLGSWTPWEDSHEEFPAGADGQYGGASETAVEKFQEGHDLIVTGIADGVTLHFVGLALGTKGQEALDLDHTHGIVVTIPERQVTIPQLTVNANTKEGEK
ncbi:MAG: peptidoglycan-binding domain-containing protein [Actinomycetota bacterium]